MNAQRIKRLVAEVDAEWDRYFSERPVDADELARVPVIVYRYSCGALSDSDCHMCDELSEALGLAGEAIITAKRERNQARAWRAVFAFVAIVLGVAVGVLLGAR